MNSLLPLPDLEEAAVSLDKDLYRFNGKVILVTGGSGFLGRCFCDFFAYINRYFLYEPCTVISVDNHIVPSSLDKPQDSIQYLSHDVTQPLGMKLSQTQRIDFIISAAGIASPRNYRKFPLETLDVSYLGTRNALELAFFKGVESLISFSSSEIYVTPSEDQIPTPETYIGAVPTMSERSCYDVGKEVLETLCHVFHQTHNVPIKVIRPFNVYGPGMGLNDFRVLPNFARAAIDGTPLKVYGDGKQTRTYCYISDALVGFLKVLLLGKSGGVYNIGNDKPEVSVNELASIFTNVCDTKSIVEVSPYPKSYPSTEPTRRCPNINKAKEELGYSPKTPLDEGIKRYFDWAKQVDNKANEG